MLAAVSDWLRHLVFLILLAVLVELVLPDNSLQKYARAVFGLLIMLSMLNPLRVLFATHLSASAFTSELSGPLFSTSQAVTLASDNQYKIDLGNVIRSDIAASFGVHLVYVQIQTIQHADGSNWVTGVRALAPPGSSNSAVVEAMTLQIAELLGLPVSAVSVTTG